MGLMGLLMADCGGLQGILSGLSKSTDHQVGSSRVSIGLIERIPKLSLPNPLALRVQNTTVQHM